MTLTNAVRCLVLLCLLVLPPAITRAAETAARTLYVYTWYDYFDSEVINDFQRKFNCRVEVSNFISNEDMYRTIVMDGESYDIVTPSSYMAAMMQGSGLLQPVDRTKIPNLKNLFREAIPKTLDPDHSYSVPYTLSIAGVLYDKQLVDKADAGGWDIFGNPAYAGRMTLMTDMRETIGAALKRNGRSVNSKSEDELREAEATIRRWLKNGCRLIGDDQPLALHPRNRIVSHAFSGDAALAISENADAGFYVPNEGSQISSDDFVIMANAENPDLAHEFINFFLEPDVARRNMEGIFFFMPNKPAVDMLPQALQDNPAFTLQTSAIDRCELLEDLGEFTAKYEELWEKILESAKQ